MTEKPRVLRGFLLIITKGHTTPGANSDAEGRLHGVKVTARDGRDLSAARSKLDQSSGDIL